jgi:hypothetical protein
MAPCTNSTGVRAVSQSSAAERGPWCSSTKRASGRVGPTAGQSGASVESTVPAQVLA